MSANRTYVRMCPKWDVLYRMPHGRITLWRWSLLNRIPWSDAVAMADAGRLPGLVLQWHNGRRGPSKWIALDMSLEPIELRLRMAGWHRPPVLPDDVEVRADGTLWVRRPPD